MKKSTFLTGFLASVLFIIGIFMKIMHWPGAGIVIVISSITFAFGYSVLLFLDKNKLAQNNLDKTANAITTLTILGVVISFMFKAQHWPGAGILIYIAHLLLLATIAVLYLQGSKENDTFKKLHYNNMAIILTIITAISLYIWWRTATPAVTP